MRSGILRKGLPPQWQSNTAVETSFLTNIIYIQIFSLATNEVHILILVRTSPKMLNLNVSTV